MLELPQTSVPNRFVSRLRSPRAATGRSVSWMLALAAALVPALCAAPAHAALSLPQDFVVQALPWNFDNPTCMAFLPDGRMLVGEKGGIVYVVAGAQRHSLWVNEDEVLNTGDRGLVGIAVDPRFTTNRYLYFLYSVDPDSNGVEFDHYDDCFARLTRYRLSATNPDTVEAASRTVLIGVDWAHGFPNGSESHAIGALVWGRDGSLLLAAGDGAQFDYMDAGGNDPGLFGPGLTNPAQDVGAFRSQQLSGPDGKILRVDPATGLALPSNPFYDGDVTSDRSRVFAYGLRNPFRFAVRPGTGSTQLTAGNPGTLYIGDVGWYRFEELEVARSAGLNFGWPCYEGFDAQPDYQAASPASSGCATIGTPANPSPARAPLLAFHHDDPVLSTPSGVTGSCVVAGAFYPGNGYPSIFKGRFFMADYVEGWIRTLLTDGNDALLSLDDFGYGANGPVAFVPDPGNGDLWFAERWSGLIQRIRYIGTAAVLPPPAIPFSLSEPWPNPSRGRVRFTLTMPREGDGRFAVFDAAGRQVWDAGVRHLPAGSSAIDWDGTTSRGVEAGPGLYFARVTSASATTVRRFAVVR